MRLALVAALLLSTAPAFAVDAVTYKGTLGKYDIVVELTEGDTAAGRYSYMAKGGDIPLDAVSKDDEVIVLSEEAPCTEETCTDSDDVPVGATWTLSYNTEGGLAGHWTPASKGNVLDIGLAEIGRRTLPDDAELSPYALYDSVFRLTYGDNEFTAQTAPYEFAKMDVKLDDGAVETLEGSSFRYVSDPRTKFPFPRIISLADGSSPDAANAALASRHARINYYAFDCLGQVYAGFGANQYSSGMGAGTLGDYDSEQVTLAYLSPTVLNWVESGSTYCTGAHPNNHIDTYKIDVRTGAQLPLAKIFTDWVATSNIVDYDAPVVQAEAVEAPQDYLWQAGQPLIDYAIAQRAISVDADYERNCGINDLIASNLALRFVPGEQVLFTIEGLPNVSFACGEDLFTVKLSDIPELLAPTARDYFPSLAK